MKEKQATLQQEKPDAKPPTVKFKSTKATKLAAHKTTLGIGTSVLEHIAEQLGSKGEPCFQENGSPTDQTDSALSELAHDAMNDWLELALADGWLDRDVVNETRVGMGLQPIS